MFLSFRISIILAPRGVTIISLRHLLRAYGHRGGRRDGCAREFYVALNCQVSCRTAAAIISSSDLVAIH